MQGEFRASQHGGRQVKVADWRDAEELAEWHLKSVLGVREVRRTPSGNDGGVDVRGRGVVAQVKFWQKPVGSPDLQRLVGAALEQKSVFYSLSGYTSSAIDYAERAEVALFEFTIYADVKPANYHARVALSSAKKPSPSPLTTSLRPPASSPNSPTTGAPRLTGAVTPMYGEHNRKQRERARQATERRKAKEASLREASSERALDPIAQHNLAQLERARRAAARRRHDEASPPRPSGNPVKGESQEDALARARFSSLLREALPRRER